MKTADYLLNGGTIYVNGRLTPATVAISNGKVVSSLPKSSNPTLIDVSGLVLLPSFVDTHVHFREPGFSYKETILSGSAAAARGGYTSVYTMPNLNPVPDSLENLRPQLDLIARDGKIKITPFGSITVGEAGIVLSKMEEIAPFVAGFSDDGRGVQNKSVMKDAMDTAAALNKTIVAHCEENTLLPPGGAIHDGQWAKDHSVSGIPSSSEWKMIERDLELLKDTHSKYHVCHVSTKESISLIRAAKADGLNVSCETAPHYLVLDDTFLPSSPTPADGRFKMNPPLRSPRDREALVEALVDGTIDTIATDHAPHSFEEKNRGLLKSAFGIVGLETAFPILFTYLVQKNILSLKTIIDNLSYRPRELFGGRVCEFSPGNEASFCVWNLKTQSCVDPAEFLSMGKSTPFEGYPVSAEAAMTFFEGRIVYKNKSLIKEEQRV